MGQSVSVELPDTASPNVAPEPRLSVVSSDLDDGEPKPTFAAELDNNFAVFVAYIFGATLTVVGVYLCVSWLVRHG